MKAVVGDRLRTLGRMVGDPVRSGRVIEVRGEDGQPPFLVRWDDGHEGVFVPRAETMVEHPRSP